MPALLCGPSLRAGRAHKVRFVWLTRSTWHQSLASRSVSAATSCIMHQEWEPCCSAALFFFSSPPLTCFSFMFSIKNKRVETLAGKTTRAKLFFFEPQSRRKQRRQGWKATRPSGCTVPAGYKAAETTEHKKTNMQFQFHDCGSRILC